MYKVLKTFMDRYTKEIYHKGEEHAFSDQRAEEILEVGAYIEKIAEEVEEPKVEDKPKKAKKSKK